MNSLLWYLTEAEWWCTVRGDSFGFEGDYRGLGYGQFNDGDHYGLSYGDYGYGNAYRSIL